MKQPLYHAPPTSFSSLAGLSFLAMVLLQGFHELEHIVQVLQRFVFGIPDGAGILGTWLDIEPVHLVYNGSFLLLILLSYWLGGFARKEGAVWWLMTFALVFQSYHFVEHLFKIAQFLESGMNGTPGILGHFVNLTWLHFAYNSLVYAPILAVFFLGGFWRGGLAALANPFRARKLRAQEP